MSRPLLIMVLPLLLAVSCHGDPNRDRCFGDGAASWQDIHVTPAAAQVTAGPDRALLLSADGAKFCVGQSPGLSWSLDPPVGTLRVDSVRTLTAEYRPPKTLTQAITVSITVQATNGADLTRPLTSTASITVSP